MILLARSTLDDWPGAILAGLIFSLMPFRPPQLMAGHPNGVSVMFLPLALFLIHHGIQGRLWASLGAGLTFAAIALTDMQLAYFGAMLMAGFGCWRLLVHGIEAWREHQIAKLVKRLLPNVFLMVVGALPGLVYLLYVKLVMLKQSAIHGGGEASGQIGPAVKDLWDVTVCGERRIYMGPYVIAFAVAGVVLPFLLKRKGSKRFRFDVLFWVVMALGGIGLSLSLNPPFNRIVDHIPIARLSRTPARATVITFVALALLSAQALAALRGWLRRWSFGQALGLGISLLCMALVIGNYWLSGPRGINVLSAASPVYENITEANPDSRVLAIPIWPGDSAMSSSLFHHIIKSRAHLLNGYSPVASSEYRSTVFDHLQSVNVGLFGQQEWARARALGISNVTFHPESFPAPGHVSVFPADLTLARLKQSPGLEWIEHHDPIDGFRVRQEPVWSASPALAISPVSYCVAGYQTGMPGGSIVEEPASVAGRVQVCGDGGTNDICRWQGRVLPVGQYTVRVRLRIRPPENTASGLLQWSMTGFDSTTSNTIAKAVFSKEAEDRSDAFRWFSLPLSISQAQRVGLSLAASDPTRFEVDVWTIGFTDAAALTAWEAEDLFHAGRTQKAGGATGRGVVQLGNADPTESVIRGPYRWIPGGEYVIHIRFRGQSSAAGAGNEIARLKIASHLSPAHRRVVQLGETALKAGVDAQAWQEQSLKFTAPPEGAILECCLDRLPGGIVEVDKLWLKTPSLP